MNTKLHSYNVLLLKHNKYVDKLARLERLGENEHRQAVLRKHLTKLKRQLRLLYTQLRRNKAITAAAGAFLLGMALGHAQIPTYKQLVVNNDARNPFGLENIGMYSNESQDQLYASPALGDLDGDGDLDLLVGDSYGQFYYFENKDIDGLIDTTLDGAFYEFVNNSYLEEANNNLFFGSPSFIDLNNDGDLDLLVGASNGEFYYFDNEDIDGLSDTTIEGASFVMDNSIHLLEIDRGYSSPAFVDLDGDGDYDVLAGSFVNGFFYYQNTGVVENPVFETPLSASIWSDNVAIPTNEFSSRPAVGDLDRDGDFDFISGTSAGNFYYFQNRGNFENLHFSSRVSMASLGQANMFSYSTPVLGDLDGDGDLDLLTGSIYGDFYYYENVDQDLDNDGILDVQEVTFWEVDHYVSYAIWGDEDGDGIPNYRDTSDDGNSGDGSVTNYTDSNNDRIADIFDSDLDGKPNYVDLDADNDGIPDVIEAQSTNSFIVPGLVYGADDGIDTQYPGGLIPIDTDSDGVPDFLDSDSDNDMLSDAAESGMVLNAVYNDNGLDTALNYPSYDSPTAGMLPTDYPNNGTGNELDYRNEGFTMSVSKLQTGTIRILENPITNHFQLLGLSDVVNIAIYNSAGGLMQTISNYRSGEIPVDLANGVYYTHITHNSTLTVITLVVVK